MPLQDSATPDPRIEVVAKAMWDEDETSFGGHIPGYRLMPWDRAHQLDHDEYRSRAGRLIALADEAEGR